MVKQKTDAEIAQEELRQQELEQEEYMKLFAEQNGTEVPSADDDEDDPSVGDDSENSPDDKDPDYDDARYKDDDDEAAPESKKSKSSSSQKGKASDDTSKGKTDPYAWIDDLPEDVREQAKALRHQYVSTTGRISAYQRRLQEADEEAALIRRQLAERSSENPDSHPTTEEEELAPELQEFIDKYPELAKAIRGFVATERKSIDRVVDAKLSPITSKEAAEATKAARARLSEGAAEIFNTAETGVNYTDVIVSPLYKDVFLRSMPKDYQNLATTTRDPETALMVMRDFAEFVEKYAEENHLMEEEEKFVRREPTVTKADKVSARRKGVKEAAPRPHQKSVVTDPEDNGDYDTYFRTFSSAKT